MNGRLRRLGRLAPLAAVVAGPVALTGVLLAANPGNPQNYVYLYLGVVAVLGLGSGLGAALVAAGLSFLLVDYLFVAPVHTFRIADSTDLVNLCVFFGAAGLVGTVGSRRLAAQRRAEALAQELQAANIELARLAETERQVRVLEQSDRLRREVLAEVSHELRTPLASILTGSTSILRRTSLPDDLRGDVDSLATAARRLNRLVSDILDITRIEGGVLELRPVDVDLRDAIDAAVLRLRRKSPEREVIVSVPAQTPEVLADWDRLGQVLDNLLDNADRVAPPESPVLVEARRTDGGDVVVAVSDHGPGVPAEIRDRVFDRFVTGGAGRDEPARGIGLGLPIVRGLVAAQGGRVWLEDPADGAGARFVFSLPTAAAGGEASG
ncbi:MAG: DUF4118 domain-containing protein [Chloroflexi bacterium]|nr:MAG: DUF4118 domain-containing protein [Chloroflexota bacterium]